jgi:hypothetical protein
LRPPKCTSGATGPSCLNLPQAVRPPIGLTPQVAQGPAFTDERSARFNEAGIQGREPHAAVWGDVNNDGFDDLFLANFDGVYTGPGNQLWLNDGFGTFSQSANSPTGGSVSSEAAAFGDADGDGNLDLFVGNSAAYNELWMGDGSGVFTANHNVIAGGNAGATATTYAAAWGDCNNDGRLDLFVGNNWDDSLFVNGGNAGGSVTFTDTTVTGLTDDGKVTTAVAWADACVD